MPTYGMPSIEHGEWNAYCAGPFAQANDAWMKLFQSCIESIAPHCIAQEKESQNLEEAIAIHKLPHTLDSPLHEKQMYGIIAVGITKPCGKIAFCYTITICLCPPSLFYRNGNAYARRLLQEIHRSWQKEQYACRP